MLKAPPPEDCKIVQHSVCYFITFQLSVNMTEIPDFIKSSNDCLGSENSPNKQNAYLFIN